MRRWSRGMGSGRRRRFLISGAEHHGSEERQNDRGQRFDPSNVAKSKQFHLKIPLFLFPNLSPSDAILVTEYL
jgi:hypothetical protein